MPVLATTGLCSTNKGYGICVTWYCSGLIGLVLGCSRPPISRAPSTGPVNILGTRGNNRFGTTIPWEVVILTTNLKTIELREDLLAGPIPSRKTKLTGLESFRAWGQSTHGNLAFPSFLPACWKWNCPKILFMVNTPESWAALVRSGENVVVVVPVR